MYVQNEALTLVKINEEYILYFSQNKLLLQYCLVIIHFITHIETKLIMYKYLNIVNINLILAIFFTFINFKINEKYFIILSKYYYYNKKLVQ